MKISTKGRYALRIMIDLAVHKNCGYIPLKDIARRQDISDKYSEQIVNTLVKSDMVTSVRGAKGGYTLSKKPDEYTVGDILRVTEGTLVPVACMEDEVNTCDRVSCCVTINVYKKIKEAVDNVVDNISLADLENDYITKNGSDYII